MKKLSILVLSLASAAFLFAACQNNDPAKDQDPTSVTDVPTEGVQTEEATGEETVPAMSDEDVIIEPVTLKTEPAEDITEDIGDIVEPPVDENPEIPEENPEEPIGEGEIPEESSEEESLPE